MLVRPVVALFFAALATAEIHLQGQLLPNTNLPSIRAVWAGADVTLTAGVSGAGPLTYQWQFHGKNLTNGIITTVAGGGIGDGLSATNAVLALPGAVIVDQFGNLFIADTGNNRVRIVTTNSLIATYAGNGSNAFYGDNGLAATAALNGPDGLAMDAFGNLFIADTGNHRVRKVDSNGIITTVAGNGINSYSGDGSAATSACFSSPTALAVDAAGNLFIADTGNERIREVTVNGIALTVAGTGTNGYTGDFGPAIHLDLSQPQGLAFASDGSLFIADTGNGRIRRLAADGTMTTLASGLVSPTGLAFASSDLFVAESEYIVEISTNGTVTTYAGDGESGYDGDNRIASSASLNCLGVAVDLAGHLLIADTGNNRIRKVNAAQIITTIAGGGIGDGGPAVNAALSSPADVCLDSSGNFFIADTQNNRIRQVSLDGMIRTVAGNGQSGSGGDGGPALKAKLNQPVAAVLDTGGNLFLADNGNSRIRKVDTNGIITTVAGGGFHFPTNGVRATAATLQAASGVAVDAEGNLFVSDSSENLVFKITTNGILTRYAGTNQFIPRSLGDGGPATNAVLNKPEGLAFDSAGDLFIADSGNNRIRKVDTNGVIVTVAYYTDKVGLSDYGLKWPYGVAVDDAGDTFIADTGNSVVEEINGYGILVPVAGWNEWAAGILSGDGGAATNAALSNPQALAFDAFGNLFIADTGDNRIRKVTYTQGPVLALNNVSRTNAGAYTLIATGPTGRLTNGITLLVATAPQTYQSAFNPDGSLTLNFVSPPDSTNLVLAADILTPPIPWLPISTNLAGPDGDWSFTDTNASGFTARFYRSQTLPISAAQ